MDCFSSFERLDGCSVIMSDDHLYIMEGIGTVRIKMFDGMVQKLKEVQYVYQLKKILIFVGVLEALSLEVPIRDGIL